MMNSESVKLISFCAKKHFTISFPAPISILTSIRESKIEIAFR